MQKSNPEATDNLVETIRAQITSSESQSAFDAEVMKLNDLVEECRLPQTIKAHAGKFFDKERPPIRKILENAGVEEAANKAAAIVDLYKKQAGLHTDVEQPARF